jgi:two-component system, OmpR family, response regulator
MHARIVVADDHPDTVDTFVHLLRREGYEVRGVYQGADVLNAICDFAADVVLLDIGMPAMSGYDVARELRNRYGSARPFLIAFTGRNEDGDRKLARLAGFDRYLKKSTSPEAVLALLSEVSRRSGQRLSPAGPSGGPADRPASPDERQSPPPATVPDPPAGPSQ